MPFDKLPDFHIIVRDWVGKRINLHLLWDIHWGAANCREDLLDLAIAEIKADPNALFVLGGDNLEAIGSIDWRSFAGKFDNFPREMKVKDLRNALGIVKRTFISKFKPIKNKGVVMLTGNHEDKWASGHNMDISQEMATELDIPYGGYECGLVFAFQYGKEREDRTARIVYHKGMVSHGWGGGQQLGGKANRQRLWADQFQDIRFTVRGHTHDLADLVYGMVQMRQRRSGAEWIAEKFDRHDIIAGTFHDSAYYAVKAGYRAQMDGWKVLELELHNNRIGGAWDATMRYVRQNVSSRP
jgi:hypothetical protein